jgi:hypothetical protein
MAPQTLEGHLGTHVAIDVCPACQAFWFDHLESLRLSPGATLQLFRMIGAQPRPPGRGFPDPMKCPRCEIRLLTTTDRQRNTPFHYWRCPREHGRLITFLDFLREKDFIRPLSPRQLAELRQQIQMINCSSCGAPIDLTRASACAHCGAPISMLDLKPLSEASRGRADQSAPVPEPDAAAVFAALRLERDRDNTSRPGLVETGLRLVSEWLSGS